MRKLHITGASCQQGSSRSCVTSACPSLIFMLKLAFQTISASDILMMQQDFNTELFLHCVELLSLAEDSRKLEGQLVASLFPQGRGRRGASSGDKRICWRECKLGPAQIVGCCHFDVLCRPASDRFTGPSRLKEQKQVQRLRRTSRLGRGLRQHVLERLAPDACIREFDLAQSVLNLPFQGQLGCCTRVPDHAVFPHGFRRDSSAGIDFHGKSQLGQRKLEPRPGVEWEGKGLPDRQKLCEQAQKPNSAAHAWPTDQACIGLNGEGTESEES